MNDENAVPPAGPVKPASPRKLASCRVNGAKSNGPKTEAGKHRSAQNARKHGLTAVTVVVANEDQAEFDQLHAAYFNHFQPRNPVEIDLVAEMVCAKWRQRRLWSVESAQLDLQMVQQRAALDRQFEFITEDVRTALAYQEKAKPGDSFFALNRYESRLSRQYHRALRTLMELQSNRPPAQPSSELTTDNRQLTTEQLPNEPNPASGHRPEAQSSRFRMREVTEPRPQGVVTLQPFVAAAPLSGAGVHACSGSPDPQTASSQPTGRAPGIKEKADSADLAAARESVVRESMDPLSTIDRKPSAFLLHFTSGNERMSVPDMQL